MRLLITLFYSLLLFCTIFSCRDESSSIGSKWVESSFINVVTDTCMVTLSTLLAGSLATSGDTICQIGRFKDALYGEIKTSFYAEYQVPSHSLNETTDYQFDSITFKWYTSGDYLGDTLVYHRIDLYSLSQGLSLEDNGYLFNKTNVSYNQNNHLGSVSIRPTPGYRNELHETRLPDEWGKKWFNLMLEDDECMESQERFRAFFKGIAFIPDENGTCINGFQVNDSSFCITLYYHELKEKPTEQTLVFNASTSLNYTKVEHDRTNTPLENLKAGTDYELPSSESEHQVYLQGLTGMYINVEFPYLNNLNQTGRLVSIESAVLKLYPIKGTYNGKYPLPKSLSLYTADQNNATQSVITDISGNTVQTGSLVEDNVYYEDTHYSFDITSFIQNNLGTAGESREKLQIFLSDNAFYNTVQGVVLGDSKHPVNDHDNNVSLTIYYKTYTK